MPRAPLAALLAAAAAGLAATAVLLPVARARAPEPAAPRADDAPAAVLAAAGVCHGAPPPADPAEGPARPPGLVAGLGDAGFRVERARPEAAAYFGEGVRLFHAFNAPEAVRALRWAEHEDPDCAMCAWAEAWARGPTINYPAGADAAKKAHDAAERAFRLQAGLSPVAQGLIAAARARYPSTLGIARVDDRAYAKAMTALAERFPADDAVAVEAASALLIASGQAWANLAAVRQNADVGRARALLETVLARSPDYTPAIHYDIHLMEWTGEPARAVAAADRLGALAPAAGHLVHMPSHLYYRLGRYADAASANARAVAADRAFVREIKPPGGLPELALHAHNVSFGLAGALMDGDGPAALAFARAAQDAYGAHGVGARGYLAWARFGDPAEVLRLPKPAGDTRAEALWRFARGEAFFRTGDAAGLKAEAVTVARFKDGDINTIALARLTLEGRLAVLEHRPADAVAAFRKAADLRDKVDTIPDPPLWPLPPRRSLGAALLLAGDAKGARAELARSLVTDPGDPLALYALAQAQKAEHAPEASRTEALARKAWRGDSAAFRLETI